MVPVATMYLFGLAGDDFLAGGLGNDTIDGGSGLDYADFAFDAGAVVVDLAAGTATGQGVDLLLSIEQVRGSAAADTLRGDGGFNYLDGFDGDDVLEARHGDDGLRGGAGNDTLYGGGLFNVNDAANFNEFDYADYSDATAGVVVNLAAGTASGDASVGVDRLFGVESARGSAFADTWYGGSGSDFEAFMPGAGNDLLFGNGIAEVRADYSGMAGGITVTLLASGNGTVVGSVAGTDLLFERQLCPRHHRCRYLQCGRVRQWSRPVPSTISGATPATTPSPAMARPVSSSAPRPAMWWSI